jgi:hypothetical protein
MIIAWISQHEPTPSQRAELIRLFGPHTLDVDTNPFGSAEDIARRIRRTGAAEVVCVAPLSVLRELLSFGFRPLNAQMEACPPAQAEVTAGRNGRTRHLRFRNFRRLTSIEMRYEELCPTAPKLT